VASQAGANVSIPKNRQLLQGKRRSAKGDRTFLERLTLTSPRGRLNFGGRKEVSWGGQEGTSLRGGDIADVGGGGTPISRGAIRPRILKSRAMQREKEPRNYWQTSTRTGMKTRRGTYGMKKPNQFE